MMTVQHFSNCNLIKLPTKHGSYPLIIQAHDDFQRNYINDLFIKVFADKIIAVTIAGHKTMLRRNFNLHTIPAICDCLCENPPC